MMNTAKQPSDFAERLRRIEEKRSQSGKSPIREGRKDLRYPSTGSENGLRNAFIAVMLALGISTTGYATFFATPSEPNSSTEITRPAD